MKPARIFIFTFLTMFTFYIVEAQPGYHDVVYLKNGNIIRGIIIEQVPQQSIKIQTRDKSIYFFTMSEIEKLTKEKPNRKPVFDEKLNLGKENYSGFAITVEVCLGEGNASYNDAQPLGSAHALLGYMHQSKFILGLALGFSQWSANLSNEFMSGSPILDGAIALRYFPLKKRVSPLVIGDFGYGLVTDNYYSGGLQYTVGAGVRFNLTQRRAVSAALVYKSQFFRQNKYYTINYYNNAPQVSTFYLNGFCLQAAFTF